MDQSGVDWRDGGVPVSRRFDDPYFSLDGGLAEAGHVFLAGNDLPGRFFDGMQVAELGFGTGLNLLALCAAWAAAGQAGRLRFTSFEAYPLSASDMRTALKPFPAVAGLAEALFAAWATGDRAFRLGPVEVEVIEGDARLTLDAWPGRADAWFLDGFAPARNPELWESALLAGVAAHTRPGGTFATYTAAGGVRRDLAAAGFDVLRVAGYGRKRHMSRGRLKDRE